MKVKHRLKSLLNGRFSLSELISLAVKSGKYLHSAIVYFYRKPSGAKTVSSSDLCNTETD